MSTPRAHIRRSLLVALLMLPLRTLLAQQDPMYTMYMWNMMAIQPGYAGSADVLNVTAVSRTQWSGLAGAPVTHSLSAHAPVNARSLAMGAGVVHDRIGRMSTSSVFGDLAYRIRLSSATRLSFGLKFGFDHSRIENSLVENTDPADPAFSVDQTGGLFPNYGFGTYLWSPRWYIGAAIPKLRSNHLITIPSADGGMSVGAERPHLFITGGRVWQLGTVAFKPAFLIKAAEGAPMAFDVSANFLFHERFWLGAAYRDGDSASGIFSIQLNDQFRAGYAYDHALTILAGRGIGSHELMLSYDPIFNKNRIRSPRYF